MSTLAGLRPTTDLRQVHDGYDWEWCARRLRRRLFLTQGLAAQVSARPELGEAEFAEVAPIILAGRTGIRAINLAKNTVVSHIYPREGNFAAQGLRLLEVAEQRAAVERALETRQTVVAGRSISSRAAWRS